MGGSSRCVGPGIQSSHRFHSSAIVSWMIMVLLGGAASIALAQSRTCSIVGTVTDSSGAVVAGAKVTVVDILTGEVASSVTTEQGEYTVLNLLYGRYSVTVDKAGFRKLERSGLDLEIGQRLRVDAALQVGAEDQVVEVSGESPLLATQTSTVNQVITSKEVLDLPLNGRNWLSLATLAPGVVAPRTTTGPGAAAGSAITVNGNNADMNNFTIDGSENNAPLSSNQALNPTIDGIQEFEIQSSISPAEYDGAAAQISVATKSGSNKWNGDAYEFLRNDAPDAKSYFDLPTNRKPPLRQNMFGGTLGGPIVRNKSFFFFSYDVTRIKSWSTAFAILPPAAFMKGDFSSLSKQLTDGHGNPLPGNQVPASSINPTASALLAFYPQQNYVNPTYNFQNVIGSITNGYEWSLRVDHNFSEKNQFFARATLHQNSLTSNGAFSSTVPIGGDDTQTPAASIGASYSHFFSNSAFNTLNVSYAYFNSRRTPQGWSHNFGSAVQAPSVEDPKFQMIGFSITGYTGIGYGDRWIKEPDHVYNLTDNFSWIHGAHSFKFGAMIRRWQDNLAESFSYTMSFDGRYTGNSVADMLYGYAASASSFAGSLRSNLRRWDEGYFAQDDWRVSKRLTLNLGIRWDYIGPKSDASNNLENFDFSKGTVTYPGTPQWPTGNDNRTFRVLDNFAPRFGFAWAPRETSQTVFRGGYGVFYVPSEGQFDLITGPKDDPIYTYSPNPANPSALGFANPAPVGNIATAGFPSVSAADPHIATPYVQQWNITVQHEFPGHILLQTGYFGNRGIKLGVIVRRNVPLPGPGAIQQRRPYPTFGTIENNQADGLSFYDGWQTKMEKRYSQGLSVLASYAWGRAIDNNSFLGTRIYDPYNFELDRGDSNQDVRSRFVIGWTYELPVGQKKPFLNSSKGLDYLLGGWSIGSITDVETGMPFTATASGDPANWGNGTRPNVIANPSLSNPTIQQWFNTTAFQNPAPYTVGNERRNMLHGPGLNNWDGIVAKQFHFGETNLLQFRSEFFNAFNHPQFNNPAATLGVATFGKISSVNPGRIIQFGLKYYF